jgi:hypothetical protein
MNMGSDCYGSFAHGIGAELLTESVQVEGLGREEARMKTFNPDSHPSKQLRVCTIAMVMPSKVESRSMSGHVKIKR